MSKYIYVRAMKYFSILFVVLLFNISSSFSQTWSIAVYDSTNTARKLTISNQLDTVKGLYSARLLFKGKVSKCVVSLICSIMVTLIL